MQTVQSETAQPLSTDELRRLDAWWRAANYLSVGQIYLIDNPLIHEPLRREHVKPRLLGHFGTTPGLNLLYAHLNRAIRARDLNAIYVCGPGHGGPGVVANAYLEGTYSELYPEVGLDEDGLRHLVRQFSFPGGIPSHAAPETPGSIHEGGELEDALVSLLEGYGWQPLLVAGDEPEPVHQALAGALDEALDAIARIQEAARENGAEPARPRWPMLVLRTPKGWTGPKEVDGVPVEGTWRSHQVPVLAVRENPAHLQILEDWMRSYRAGDLFDGDGRLVPELAALAPRGERRMSANPHANGGVLLSDLSLPDFRDYAIDVE